MGDKCEKKSLMIASVASMIDQFNIDNIKLLLSLGYHVDVAANFTEPGSITIQRAEDLKRRLTEMGVQVYNVPIPRTIHPRRIIDAYNHVKELVTKERYDLIHCHSPIGGALTRLAAKKERNNGTYVIYTAHGFHFYKGAPLKNWLLFYPVERILSKYTDILITINEEDYERAKVKLKAKRIEYIPGVGVNCEKFFKLDKCTPIRQELGIKKSDIVLLSVGELNDNKNHEIVIKAFELLCSEERFRNHLYYLIVGKGPNEDKYEQMILQKGLDGKIKLLGYRSDIAEIYHSADVFVFPSFREGLSVSLMEAMASGLPIACSGIRGNRDLVDKEGGVLFDPKDERSVADAIRTVIDMNPKMSEHNKNKIMEYDIVEVNKRMKSIYISI